MNEELGPDSTGSLWNRFDTTWRGWGKGRRLTVFLVAFALVFSATVLVISAGKAVGAEAQPQVQAQKQCQPGGHPELQCLTNHQLVKRFKAGKLGRVHGFKPAAHFKNPKHFRKLAHAKMVRFLRHHPKAEGQLRHRFLTKVAERDPGCTDTCLAWKIYGNEMAKSNCNPTAPVGSLSPFTCKAASHSCCGKWVVRGITLAYCGGTLILGATGAIATDGAAIPAEAVIWGGIGCGWGFLASFS